MGKLKVLITGDFFGGNKIAPLIDTKNYKTIFGDMVDEIRMADIAITNLESPLFNEPLKPIKKTGPALKSKTNVLEALDYAGFKILTLANNHILDFGVAGLNKTIKAIESSNLTHVGVGNSIKEASTTKYIKEGKFTIAIINFCENEWSTACNNKPGANPLNPVENYYSILEAKKNADKVIVIFHGGIEFSSLPTVNFKKTCRFFIDAGANAVICHHTHFMSGYEKYNDGLIFYGIGNFVFDNPNYMNHEWNHGYAVELDIMDDKLDYRLIPYKQCNEKTGIVLLNSEENLNFEKKISLLNKAISADETLEKELNIFAKKTEKLYLSHLQPYSNRILKGLFKRGFIPSLYKDNKYRLFLNIIRCESHLEVLKKVLKNKTKS